MNPVIRIKLSVMMLLQFFIWGIWFVTMGTYLANSLKANGLQIGAAYGMMAIATIISPFIIGIIADRFFAPKKVFALLHFIGGIVLFGLSRIVDVNTFNWVLLLYALLYAPTLGLASSIAFSQLKDVEKSFSEIRVFGTIGWIIAGVSIDKLFNISTQDLGLTFTIAAIASVLLAAFSLFLPQSAKATEVPAEPKTSVIGSEAFVLFKNRSFTLFFITSIFICIPLSFYFSLTNLFLNEIGLANATSKMAFGQFSEAAFIILIPFFLKRWGVKWMLVAGMIAWVVRFLFFRYGDAGENSWMLITGIVLHGICYDFFFVTGQIYTDRVAPKKYRNAAQGMITMATYGIGMWIGSILSGFVAKNAAISETAHRWELVWIVPAAIAGVVMILFIIFFKDKNTATSVQTA
ncbi:MAG TPA: MFS transporter [Pedobacter sp.]|jgi:nucleoside transporter